MCRFGQAFNATKILNLKKERVNFTLQKHTRF